METKIIAFNGPPKSGKDTVGHLLQLQIESNYNYQVGKLALVTRLRKMACEMAGYGQINHDQYNALKDQRIPELDMTLRELMIHLSETAIKPKFGPDAWAKLAFASVSPRRVYIITDLGFYEEIDYLNRRFGWDNVMIVHLMRDGTSFDGDSRSFVGSGNIHEVWNNTTPVEAAVKVRKAAATKWNLASRK